MTIALLLTNELQVKYFTSELQMNDWSFHFDNSITDDIVEILEKLSEKNNVLVYANKQKISEQNITVYDIFPPYLPEQQGIKEAGARVASNEMCTFLILNISSLQLIPVNMIAYRSQYGSVNPAGIIAPAILATFVSTLTAVVYCKAKDRKWRG